MEYFLLFIAFFIGSSSFFLINKKKESNLNIILLGAMILLPSFVINYYWSGVVNGFSMYFYVPLILYFIILFIDLLNQAFEKYDIRNSKPYSLVLKGMYVILSFLLWRETEDVILGLTALGGILSSFIFSSLVKIKKYKQILKESHS